AIAAGPNVTGCGAGNPCYWHGTGATGVATGILNNRLGEAGTGGDVADPMLFNFNGSTFQQNRAIRTAIAWGADVVSMSFGADCDSVACRESERGENSISAYVESAPNVVFVAAAGNGRGMPAAGYNVGDPSFFHPCIVDH